MALCPVFDHVTQTHTHSCGLYRGKNTHTDPALKVGLPKPFVLALLQTTATHAVTESRRGEIRNILWEKKGTDKMNKLSQGERANITELSVE